MPYKPKKNEGLEMVRLEARIPNDVHSYLGTFAKMTKVKNVGQAVEKVAEKAVEQGFLKSYRSKIKRPDDGGEAILNHQQSVISVLRGKYDSQGVEAKVLDQVEQMLAATPARKKPETCLIDTQITEASKANKLFTKLYQDFGHKASRSKVLISMVRFVRASQPPAAP